MLESGAGATDNIAVPRSVSARSNGFQLGVRTNALSSSAYSERAKRASIAKLLLCLAYRCVPSLLLLPFHADEKTFTAIDNSDSGHAAMGMEACFRYIESQREEQRATLWRRVMTGYVLAEGLPTTPDQSNFVLDTKISTMMEKKSLISHQLHANSKVKIGGCQRLADWLHPKNFTKGETNHTFLREFANAYPWIVKGDPERSLFIKEISWNGRMYGSFSKSCSKW